MKILSEMLSYFYVASKNINKDRGNIPPMLSVVRFYTR